MLEKLFITGKLAYPALNNTLKKLDLKYDYQIVKLPITVAALMDSSFICKKLKKYKGDFLESAGKLEIIIPGRSQAEISKLEACFNNKKLKFMQGPDEIMDLPEFLGKKKIKVNLEAEKRKNKILAEINAAALLSIPEIVKKAEYYKKSGADIIDLGCVNGREFPHLEETINILKEKGFTLSIDSFNSEEIKRADKAGIDYLLSINSHNISLINGENSFTPVVIPDPDKDSLKSLFANIEELEKRGCKNYIVDPILDPVNFGFSESLFRYLSLVKEKNINQSIMMGVGNLIELSDCDSVGLNFITAALAVELNIDFLLTTEASFKTKGAVKELDLALKIISYAAQNNSLPNNISELLLNLKDRKDLNYSPEEIEELAESIKDKNYRILNDGQNINIFNSEEYYKGQNINQLFKSLSDVNEHSHAFYLGKELQKAYTALKLAKNYRQEDELNWGYLNQKFEGENNDN